jgi:predicted permease
VRERRQPGLGRGVSRRGELGVRLALGASRGRLLRQLFVENLVLALPGALAGVVIAAGALPFIATEAASAAPARVSLDTSMDGSVLAFALVLACGCALLFGFLPALRAARAEPTSLLHDLSPRLASRGRLRSMLVVAQVAVSLVLLVAAGLVLRSYAAAQHADVGFDPDNVTSIAIDLQTAGYGNGREAQAVTRLLDALDNEPAFERASLAMNVPMSLVDNASRAVEIEGYAPRTDEDMVFLYNTVAPDYFSTLSIPLLAGRDFMRTDDDNAPPAIIINEALARRMWDSPSDAIGRRIRSGTSTWRTVIGVVVDVKYSRLTDGPRPFIYFPLLQNYVTSLTVHARTAGDLNYAMRRVRHHIQAVDPAVPIVRSMTLAEQARVALSVYEMAAGTLILFGAVTILLAAIGIYGLVAFTVQQSTQEIGIRMAIGAGRVAVLRTFLGRGAGLAGLGVAIGLGLALAASGAVGSLLYGVDSRDAIALAGGTAVVMTIALVASAVPAWRASRIDPLTALRHH